MRIIWKGLLLIILFALASQFWFRPEKRSLCPFGSNATEGADFVEYGLYFCGRFIILQAVKLFASEKPRQVRGFLKWKSDLAVLDRRKNFLYLSASGDNGWLQTLYGGTFTPSACLISWQSYNARRWRFRPLLRRASAIFQATYSLLSPLSAITIRRILLYLYYTKIIQFCNGCKIGVYILTNIKH